MLPVLVRVGPVAIYSFGFFLFLGFLLATFSVWKQARSRGLSEEKVLDVFFLTGFLALLFGRLGFIFSHFPEFVGDWSRAVLFFKYPGVSLPWVLGAAVVLSLVLAWQAGLEVLLVWDLLAITAAFFSFFGYLGCFLDGCVVGFPFVPLYPLAAVVVFLGLFLFLGRKLSRTPGLAEIAKRRGLFFLCYLIFQFLSLLITAWFVKNETRVWLYAGGLAAAVIAFVVRYRDLLKYAYDSISQRRSRPNQVLS